MLGFVAFVIGLTVLFLVIRSNQQREHAAKSAGPTGKIKGDGSFSYAVVGESNYLENLRSIVRAPGEVRHYCDAVLVLEDSNPHDRNAVAVQIEAKVVGYLPREGAKQYRAKLVEVGFDRLTGQVDAVIVGGGEGRENYGVWLDLPTTDDGK